MNKPKNSNNFIVEKDDTIELNKKMFQKLAEAFVKPIPTGDAITIKEHLIQIVRGYNLNNPIVELKENFLEAVSEFEFYKEIKRYVDKQEESKLKTNSHEEPYV